MELNLFATKAGSAEITLQTQYEMGAENSFIMITTTMLICILLLCEKRFPCYQAYLEPKNCLKPVRQTVVYRIHTSPLPQCGFIKMVNNGAVFHVNSGLGQNVRFKHHYEPVLHPFFETVQTACLPEKNKTS